MAERGSSSQGPATDSANTPVIDPTVNVKERIEVEVRRLDDLRYLQATHDSYVAELRERHADKVAQLRADCAEELRLAEAKRIDAIRTVDVGNVSRAAEVSAAQAQTLANTVATSAETLRAQVIAAANAAAISLGAALVPLQEAIADLRRVQYEQQGQKAATTDVRDSAADLTAAIATAMNPVVQGLTQQGAAIEALVRERSERSGASAESAEQVAALTRARNFRFALIAAGISALGLFLGIAGVVITLVLASRGK